MAAANEITKSGDGGQFSAGCPREKCQVFKGIEEPKYKADISVSACSFRYLMISDTEADCLSLFS